MCVLAAIISFSKVLQERDELRQEVTGSPAKVERNKKTLKIQNFSVLVKLVSVPQILEDKMCRSEKTEKKGRPRPVASKILLRTLPRHPSLSFRRHCRFHEVEQIDQEKQSLGQA